MSTLLEVENLVKYFSIERSRALVQAVNDVSFSIQKGETLSLVGESGSGKTTVGRCVLGLLRSTAGSIRFYGREMGRHWNVRSRSLRGKMQLVFQEPGESLDPLIPIWQSVEEPLRWTGASRQERENNGRRRIARVNL